MDHPTPAPRHPVYKLGIGIFAATVATAAVWTGTEAIRHPGYRLTALCYLAVIGLSVAMDAYRRRINIDIGESTAELVDRQKILQTNISAAFSQALRTSNTIHSQLRVMLDPEDFERVAVHLAEMTTTLQTQIVEADEQFLARNAWLN